ncbi:MAG: 30S ribosomal protein S15 [Candidatus Woesearchaeota archaeon]
MARMHSGKKGQSGSKRPLESPMPSWVRYKSKELEMIIVKLAKEGHSPTEIGLILRDQYGVPSVKPILNKSIGAVLKEKKLLPEIPEDLKSIIRKSIDLRKHLEENNHDQTARRGLLLTDSKIKRLVKYYKKTGILPQDWKYDAESLKLAVQ